MKTMKELITPKVLLNSLISGGLVLFGACAAGDITIHGLVIAVAAGMVAFLTQLRDDIFPTIQNKSAKIGLFEFI